MHLRAKKAFAFTGLFLGAALSVALASKPKPKDCDSWKCGPSCAPTKYAAIRVPPVLLPLYGSQLYGAVVMEGGLGLLAFGLVRVASARRRRDAASAPVIRPSEPAES